MVLPAYVATQKDKSAVLAYGEEAKSMLGREPNHISVVKILVEGMIADQKSAATLFRFGLRKILGGAILIRPRVIIASRNHSPGGLSIEVMATAGGARETYLVQMGIAAAAGIQLDVNTPEIKAILSVTDDWYEFSVISLASVLVSASGAIGTRSFVEDIQNHFTLCHNFRPNFATLTSQLDSDGITPGTIIDMRGWETWAGRPEQGRYKTYSASPDELTVGMMPSLVRLTEQIKAAIRSLTPENQSRLRLTTIHATGSALKISGLAQMIANQIDHSVTPFFSEIHPSIGGCKSLIKHLSLLKKIRQSGR